MSNHERWISRRSGLFITRIFTMVTVHETLVLIDYRNWKLPAYGEMVIFYNNRLTMGAYSNTIQNFYTLFLMEFRHTTERKMDQVVR